MEIYKKLTKGFNRLAVERESFIVKKYMRLNYHSHIAMFHDIIEDSCSLEDPFTCHISDLKDYVKKCVEEGLEFVSIKSLLQVHSEECLKQKCSITFDDGFKSTLLLAAPILENQKIPYTVFITVELLNQPGYLTNEDLIKLSNYPMCTIGIHSFRHKMWRFENGKDLESDFVEAKKFLDEILDGTDRLFAFPYGSYYAVSKRNIRIIKKQGVDAIFLTAQRPLLLKDISRPFWLPRINIPGYYNGTVLSDRKVLRIGDLYDKTSNCGSGL